MLRALKGVFSYSSEELAVLKAGGDPQIVHRFTKNITVDGVDLRVVVAPNRETPKLPAGRPIVFFVHGLGGQLNQFEHQIDYFNYFADVLAVDLPGHGKSGDQPFSHYTSDRFVDLLEKVLDLQLLPTEYNKVLLVGHSMGTHIVLRLAHKLGNKCVGCVCIAPPAELGDGVRRAQSIIRWVPVRPLFEYFRAADRNGGLDSPSVNRVLSQATTSRRIREKQLRTNLQVRSASWLATFSNMRPLSEYEATKVDVPVLVVAAVDDKVTPPKNAQVLVEWIGKNSRLETITAAGHSVMIERPEVVNGLIADFIDQEVDKTLSLAWQLSYLATKTDKWSLKNEEKWKQTAAIGDIVPPSHLRGMKTLRQTDTEHSPELLEANHPEIVAVIDISREAPPYDSSTFSRIQYFKLPTVSKIPPSADEVTQFIELVDSIKVEKDQAIAVHCHYGFNRTGFFICSYLIERCGLTVSQALDAYARARPTGVHHPHFVDELHVRYEQ